MCVPIIKYYAYPHISEHNYGHYYNLFNLSTIYIGYIARVPREILAGTKLADLPRKVFGGVKFGGI